MKSLKQEKSDFIDIVGYGETVLYNKMSVDSGITQRWN